MSGVISLPSGLADVVATLKLTTCLTLLSIFSGDRPESPPTMVVVVVRVSGEFSRMLLFSALKQARRASAGRNASFE